MPSSPQWVFDRFRLDPDHACLWRDAEVIALPPKAFDLLHYFVRHPDRVVTKDELLDAVWPQTAVTDAVVRVTIGLLRKVLDDTAQTPQFIATVARRGYRFLAPVIVVHSPEAIPAEAPQPPAVPAPRAPLTYTPMALAEKIRTSRATLTGERKQITVLFADLKDSMTLIRDLDPEAAQQLLDPALHAMMDAVHRYEGTVNQVLGDGIMALFGAPIAHEDHAARACYAALAMQAALGAYAEEVRRTHGLTMQSRIGLNSGEVVVRTIHHDLHMDYSAVGQTTHLAARLEQVASPDAIVLTAATVRLVEGLVRVKAWGPMPIKGLAEPVEVWELLGVSGRRRRLQTARARGLTRFVGRQTELTILKAALAQAGAGHGQVVAVVGEAGVGKSRLVDEFIQDADMQGWLVLDSAAVSYGQATPYFPVRDLLRRYCHLEEGEDTRTVQTKVTEQVLALDPALQDTIPALLALLDALPPDSPFLQLDAPQRRQHTFAALKRLLLRQSQMQPVLLVVEDLHWLDTETQALLESLVESLPTARLLLLVNYRPDYRHGWGSKTYYTQVRLDPLPPASADAFLRALLGDDPSLASLTPLLIQRTEANPFFLEESVRTLVETGALVGEPGAYRLAHALPTMRMPATVQAVLAARIDRLPSEEKRLLQTAAVVGIEVPLTLLQTVMDLPAETLRLSLTPLQEAEFLYETSLFPELVYTFKHALTQEVAYGSLLHERRRVLHARIVEALEGLAGDRVVEQLERLAYHALRGEVWAKALAYCRQAGEKAMARSAYREAVGYFEQALGALAHLPEQRDTREQAIDLRLALRSALAPIGDFGRAMVYLHEAESLAMAFDDPRRLSQVSVYLSIHFHFMGAYDQAIATAQRALALATTSGEAVLQALANQSLGFAYHAQGDYRRATACLGQTVASLDGARRHERFGHVALPVVMCCARLAVCHAELGTFAEGRAFGEEGLRIAEAVAHPGSLMMAYYGLGLLFLRHGDLPRALPLLERAVGLCQEADLPAFFPMMAAPLGVAYTLDKRIADAVPLLTQAMEQAIAMKRVDLQALCGLSLGEAQVLVGRMEEAHVLAEHTLALTREHQERGSQAYALHLLGEIAARRNPPEVASAEASYQQTLALAEELGMRPLQAHCHHGLGTLYGTLGRREQARVELSAAIALYRAMDMTFWLPQAEAALAQVEAASAPQVD
jgi:class 3 adenylate cyclase/tetratricopeptide (TPR) repeat protein